MWYTNSLNNLSNVKRLSQKDSKSEQIVSPEVVTKIIDAIVKLEKKLATKKFDLYDISEWVSAPTETKDLYDIFTIYENELEILNSVRGAGNLDANQIKKIKQVYKLIKDFPSLWIQLGKNLTGEALQGYADKPGYTIKVKPNVPSYGNPFGLSDNAYTGSKQNIKGDFFNTVNTGITKTKISNNPIMKFLEKAGPILQIINLAGLANKVFEVIRKYNNNEEITNADYAEVISKIITIPQIAAIAGPFSPALLAAGLISDTVGIKLADNLGEAYGTTNTNLKDVLNDSVNKNKLLITLDDLKSNYGEVYNALIDCEKGLSAPQSITRHIVDNDPYKFLLFSNFRQNRERLKKIASNGKEFYPNASSNYVVSSFYKKRKEEEERRKYPGPAKPIMQP
jgi:hypothetical protein